MKAITLGASAIAAGEADLVLVGGVEVMSQAPFLTRSEVRWGWKLGDLATCDSLLADGLTDPTHKVHMAHTVRGAGQARYGITREAQDAYAAESQRRWGEARRPGAWDAEIVPVPVKGGTVTEDETPRPEHDGGEAGGIAAGFRGRGHHHRGQRLWPGGRRGGACLLGSEEAATRTGLTPLARLTAGLRPACRPWTWGWARWRRCGSSLRRPHTTADDYDLFEINEAFAAQVLACLAELPSARGRA